MLLFGVRRTPAVASSATSSSSSRGFRPPTGASRWPEKQLRPSSTQGEPIDRHIAVERDLKLIYLDFSP
ncbi:hypothetical protein AAHA92_29012 [Salvia divinorum]|uniref:Uncharacterized protein n=1 Tax=Salvia divinorum TaxID=28513 RepID=A0ABD1G042_SALDI